jgi:hypothetical protein
VPIYQGVHALAPIVVLRCELFIVILAFLSTDQGPCGRYRGLDLLQLRQECIVLIIDFVDYVLPRYKVQ